jgi:hypothetical protein
MDPLGDPLDDLGDLDMGATLDMFSDLTAPAPAAPSTAAAGVLVQPSAGGAGAAEAAMLSGGGEMTSLALDDDAHLSALAAAAGVSPTLSAASVRAGVAGPAGGAAPIASTSAVGTPAFTSHPSVSSQPGAWRCMLFLCLPLQALLAWFQGSYARAFWWLAGPTGTCTLAWQNLA